MPSSYRAQPPQVHANDPDLAAISENDVLAVKVRAQRARLARARARYSGGVG